MNALETETLLEKRIEAGTLRTKDISNDKIVVSGWVFRYRDNGGVLFIDLRERSGLLQVVFDMSESEELFKTADALRREDVILVEGTLRSRGEGAKNPKLDTGDVELLVSKLIVLSKSLPPTIPLEEHDDSASEENRLEYRFLDMRTKEMQEAMYIRHKYTDYIRNFFNNNGFWDVETPLLNKSTPEGARDFIVPSRVNPGSFYALPQSPQIFKQLLMIGQVERYYQIARCFRDEDLRADRQPEFTQIDVEMSFVTQNSFMSIMEKLIVSSLKDVFKMKIDDEVPRMTYKDAMEQYGNDKPDIRFDMKLVELKDWAATTEFKVFQEAVKGKGRLKALCVPEGASLSRKEIDDLTKWVQQDFKAKGLAWIKHTENGLESAIGKFMPDASKEELIKLTNSKQGDIIFFGAGEESVVFATLSAVRLKMGERFKLIKENDWKVLWVVDFPLFDYDKQEKRFNSLHHPFTAPVPEDKETIIEMAKKPVSEYTEEEIDKVLDVKSNAYDFVLNGVELGGGSIRIHESDLQKAIFNLLDISQEEADMKFGFLLKALQFGAPPHGGLAFGLDRILMLGLKRKSIRDVIAFPKTQRGQCLLSKAPSPVDNLQLRELYIRSLAQDKK